MSEPSTSTSPHVSSPFILPSLPLPAWLNGVEEGFAQNTILQRLPYEILARVLTDNNEWMTDAQKQLLLALQKELDGGKASQLSLVDDYEMYPSACVEDLTLWRDIMSPYLHDTWLTAPWLVVEFYFYRRLMAIINWYGPPTENSHRDPFRLQKEAGLTSVLGVIEKELAPRVNQSVEFFEGKHKDEKRERELVREFILVSLWGNKADLSLWPASTSKDDGEVSSNGGDKDEREAERKSDEAKILANDLEGLVSHLFAVCDGTSDSERRADIVVDNAGFELVSDLCLADALLASRVVDSVHFHLKKYPVFVSDAREDDLRHTVSTLLSLDPIKNPSAHALGCRWSKYLQEGKWVLVEDLFWVVPQPMWEMPREVRERLTGSTVIFVKGDANYRRLLGDRAWSLDAPFTSVVNYFPSPVCALRALKAEIGCGMSTSETDRAAKEDARWKVNGKWAVIQCNLKCN